MCVCVRERERVREAVREAEEGGRERERERKRFTRISPYPSSMSKGLGGGGPPIDACHIHTACMYIRSQSHKG